MRLDCVMVEIVVVVYFHIEYEIDKSTEINKSSECIKMDPTKLYCAFAQSNPIDELKPINDL